MIFLKEKCSDANFEILRFVRDYPDPFILEAEITSRGVNAGLARASGRYYYLKDELGIVNDVADDSGNIVQRYVYELFAKIRSCEEGESYDRKTSSCKPSTIETSIPVPGGWR